MAVLDKVVSTIAPHVCIGCGYEGAILCDACLLSAGEPPVSRCAGCKVLTTNYQTCRSCRSWLDVYAVYVATEYGGMYERLVREYKFGCKRQAVAPMASIMRQLPVVIRVEEVIVTPLPTAPARVRQRGFDHARLLAKTYVQNVTHTHNASLTYRELLSRKSNSRQLGASRTERVEQMNGEFSVKDGGHVSGRSVLLIDDVTTTGASLAAAAKALKQSGAKRVYALVFAQKT